MNLLSVEGLPVGISMLSDDDLQTLQAHYLPIIFDIKESDLCTDYSRISKNRDQRYDSDNTFELYNDIISPYLEQYIESYNFEFPYSKINKLIYNNEKLELSDKQFMDDIKLDTTVEPLQVKKDTTIASENIPKIKKITRTYTYKLGKIKGKNRIGILIKNRETQKNIKREVTILQQKSLQDIKNHLIDKNLIKAGSYAPNDVLREIYKESILAGEITNINNNNMVYNYLNE